MSFNFNWITHFDGRLEDLEQQVEQLSAVLHDTEFCLENRARQLQDLELAIVEKDSTIDTLRKEKLAKSEELVKAQQVRLQLKSGRKV